MISKNNSWTGWLICGLGALFYCYEYCLRIMPSMMTQDLLKTYNISGFAFGNLIAFYYYAYTPMQLPVGILMDRYGPRLLLIAACFFCALGTYLFSFPVLSIAQSGRFLVGFGSAFAFVGVLKLASLWLPVSRFGLCVGLTNTLGMAAGVAGNLWLPKIIAAHGTHSTMYGAILVGLVMMLVLWLVIPVTSLVDDKKLSSYRNQPAAITGQSLTFKELLKEVMIVLKKPQMWIIGVVGCFLYLALSNFGDLWGTPYLIRAYGFTTQSAGSYIAWLYIGCAIGGPLVGWLSDKINRRPLILILGAFLGCLVFSLLIYMPSFSRPFLKEILFLFGIFTSTQILVFAIARDINSPVVAATAVAVTNLITMLGGMIVEPVIGKIIDMVTGTHAIGDLMAFSIKSFEYALSIIAVCFFISAFLMFFVKDKTHSCPKNNIVLEPSVETGGSIVNNIYSGNIITESMMSIRRNAKEKENHLD